MAPSRLSLAWTLYSGLPFFVTRSTSNQARARRVTSGSESCSSSSVVPLPDPHITYTDFVQATRRSVIGFGALAAASIRGGIAAKECAEVNDIHSQLNSTCVARVVRPESLEQLRESILEARREGLAISISGSRHSMGGQQFGAGMVLLDMRGLNRVIALRPDSKTIEAEAGIEWPELLNELTQRQAGRESQLGIFQKQTGAARLSLGGALASNVHGRGLNLKPFINDVESFELMNAEGGVIRCDRSASPDLFRLVIGGYGLFGVITSVRLRLRPRVKVRRVVEIADTKDIPGAFEARIRDGYLYGDFQFATDGTRESLMRRGVFSCYQPVDPDTPLTQNPTRFHADDWARLTYYAHTHKGWRSNSTRSATWRHRARSTTTIGSFPRHTNLTITSNSTVRCMPA
jgi:hypothetical protein